MKSSDELWERLVREEQALTPEQLLQLRLDGWYTLGYWSDDWGPRPPRAQFVVEWEEPADGSPLHGRIVDRAIPMLIQDVKEMAGQAGQVAAARSLGGQRNVENNHAETHARWTRELQSILSERAAAGLEQPSDSQAARLIRQRCNGGKVGTIRKWVARQRKGTSGKL